MAHQPGTDDETNIVNELIQTILNCPNTGDGLISAMNTVQISLKSLKKCSGSFNNLQYFCILFTDKLMLSSLTHQDMQNHLTLLMDVLVDHINVDIFFEFGEHLLAYLDSNVHDLKKEQLLIYYLNLLELGRTRNIECCAIFSNEKTLTLCKFLDHTLVCKNVLLQKLELQVLHTLLPTELDAATAEVFFPDNELLQEALTVFKSSTFDLGVNVFLNHLNSRSSDIISLETLTITISGHQYGRNRNEERTYVDFNSTDDTVILHILTQAMEAHPISIRIRKSDIDNVFTKEFSKLRAAEVLITTKDVIQIKYLNHPRAKSFKFRFNLKDVLPLLLKDSLLLNVIFGNFKVYQEPKSNVMTNMSSISQLQSLPSIRVRNSTSEVSLPSISCIEGNYSANKDTVFSNTQLLTVTSLSLDTEISYSDFNAQHTSSPDPLYPKYLNLNVTPSEKEASLTPSKDANNSGGVRDISPGNRIQVQSNITISATKPNMTNSDKEGTVHLEQTNLPLSQDLGSFLQSLGTSASSNLDITLVGSELNFSIIESHRHELNKTVFLSLTPIGLESPNTIQFQSTRSKSDLFNSSMTSPIRLGQNSPNDDFFTPAQSNLSGEPVEKYELRKDTENSYYSVGSNVSSNHNVVTAVVAEDYKLSSEIDKHDTNVEKFLMPKQSGELHKLLKLPSFGSSRPAQQVEDVSICTDLNLRVSPAILEPKEGFRFISLTTTDSQSLLTKSSDDLMRKQNSQKSFSSTGSNANSFFLKKNKSQVFHVDKSQYFCTQSPESLEQSVVELDSQLNLSNKENREDPKKMKKTTKKFKKNKEPSSQIITDVGKDKDPSISSQLYFMDNILTSSQEDNKPVKSKAATKSTKKSTVKSDLIILSDSYHSILSSDSSRKSIKKRLNISDRDKMNKTFTIRQHLVEEKQSTAESSEDLIEEFYSALDTQTMKSQLVSDNGSLLSKTTDLQSEVSQIIDTSRALCLENSDVLYTSLVASEPANITSVSANKDITDDIDASIEQKSMDASKTLLITVEEQQSYQDNVHQQPIETLSNRSIHSQQSEKNTEESVHSSRHGVTSDNGFKNEELSSKYMFPQTLLSNVDKTLLDVSNKSLEPVATRTSNISLRHSVSDTILEVAKLNESEKEHVDLQHVETSIIYSTSSTFDHNNSTVLDIGSEPWPMEKIQQVMLDNLDEADEVHEDCQEQSIDAATNSQLLNSTIHSVQTKDKHGISIHQAGVEKPWSRERIEQAMLDNLDEPALNTMFTISDHHEVHEEAANVSHTSNVTTDHDKPWSREKIQQVLLSNLDNTSFTPMKTTDVERRHLKSTVIETSHTSQSSTVASEGSIPLDSFQDRPWPRERIQQAISSQATTTSMHFSASLDANLHYDRIESIDQAGLDDLVNSVPLNTKLATPEPSYSTDFETSCVNDRYALTDVDNVELQSTDVEHLVGTVPSSTTELNEQNNTDPQVSYVNSGKVSEKINDSDELRTSQSREAVIQKSDVTELLNPGLSLDTTGSQTIRKRKLSTSNDNIFEEIFKKPSGKGEQRKSFNEHSLENQPQPRIDKVLNTKYKIVSDKNITMSIDLSQNTDDGTTSKYSDTEPRDDAGSSDNTIASDETTSTTFRNVRSKGKKSQTLKKGGKTLNKPQKAKKRTKSTTPHKKFGRITFDFLNKRVGNNQNQNEFDDEKQPLELPNELIVSFVDRLSEDINTDTPPTSSFEEAPQVEQNRSPSAAGSYMSLCSIRENSIIFPAVSDNSDTNPMPSALHDNANESENNADSSRRQVVKNHMGFIRKFLGRYGLPRLQRR